MGGHGVACVFVLAGKGTADKVLALQAALAGVRAAVPATS